MIALPASQTRPPRLAPPRAKLSAVAALAAGALAIGDARADPRPLRIDYEAHAACPTSGAFLEAVRARTIRARAADPEEDALDVWVRITHRAPRSVGRLVLWKSSGARTREVEGDDCRDVVSALALITALALDPDGTRPHSSPPSPPAPPAIGPAPTAPPPSPQPIPGPTQIPWQTPPAPPSPSSPPGAPFTRPLPLPAPPPDRWIVGAHLTGSFAVTPEPLFGAGLFAERAWGDTRGASARLALEVAATGSFRAGPGAASFLRGVARLGACPFVRPTPWLGVAVCLDAEAGFLRGQGVARGTIGRVESATVPWAALGLLPRLSLDLGGSVRLSLEGGPAFPLVRRAFVFEQPDYTIHDVPAVTGVVSAAGGIRF